MYVYADSVCLSMTTTMRRSSLDLPFLPNKVCLSLHLTPMPLFRFRKSPPKNPLNATDSPPTHRHPLQYIALPKTLIPLTCPFTVPGSPRTGIGHEEAAS